MGEPSRTTTIKTLETRHRKLSEQVARLERRAFLTPTEQLEVSTLKKLKLAAKDQLFEKRRT